MTVACYVNVRAKSSVTCCFKRTIDYRIFQIRITGNSEVFGHAGITVHGNVAVEGRRTIDGEIFANMTVTFYVTVSVKRFDCHRRGYFLLFRYSRSRSNLY